MAAANELQLTLPAAADTDVVGRALAESLPTSADNGLLVELHGDLGMGKTALVRSLLRAMGITGAVRSPTYTLCEPYNVGDWQIMHLDLYRLSDPEELEYLGVRELDARKTLALVEWPANGAGWLPKPSLLLRFNDRSSLPGRTLKLTAGSVVGQGWLQNIAVNENLKDYM